MTSQPSPRRSTLPPPSDPYDLVVIGAGPAGEKGAIHAALHGKRVAIVDAAAVPGGNAVRATTLASQTLRESAAFLSGYRNRQLDGVAAALSKGATAESLQARNDAVAIGESHRIRASFDRHGVTYLNGRARFEDMNTLRVAQEQGSTFIRAHNFLVATGSEPLRPKIVPFDSNRVHDTEAIVHLAEIPPTLVVLGAGITGCEYACMFASLGSKVTLVDRRTHIMPYLDREMVDRLVTAMTRAGVEFIPSMKWDAIHAFEDLVTVDLADGRTLDTDHLLWAAGRTGRSWNLGLEQIGVMPDGRGYIPVDESYRTELSHVFAAGDVIGPPGMVSTSMEQGRIAVSEAFGIEYRRTRLLPYGIYTIPEVSCLGETEESAKKKQLDVVVARAFFSENPRGLITGDVDGMTKLVVDRETRKILGIHVIGERATELIHIGHAAMAADATVDLFVDMGFNYPTLASTYDLAARRALEALAE